MSPLKWTTLKSTHIIGSLIYLTNTRPNITQVVHPLSQFVYAPSNDHHQVDMRVLQYLKQTPRKGIFLNANSETQLKGLTILIRKDVLIQKNL